MQNNKLNYIKNKIKEINSKSNMISFKYLVCPLFAIFVLFSMFFDFFNLAISKKSLFLTH